MVEKDARMQAWPDLAGRLRDGGHVLPLRVYYEDTDLAGVVYHANYLRYCERGRSDFLRLLGIDQLALACGANAEPLNFAVRTMVIEFFKPARMDDVLEVETSLSEARGARLKLVQTVTREKEPLFSADVEVALVNRAGKPRRLPGWTLEKLVSGVSKQRRIPDV